VAPAALVLTGLSVPATAGDAGIPIRQVTPTYQETPGQQEFSGRMIVRPRQFEAWTAAGLSEPAAGARVKAAHAALAEAPIVEYVGQTDEYIIELPEGRTENEAARLLMATGLFQYAEPDWILYPLATPNDSRFGNQWHHAPNRMQSEDGWDIHTGNPSVAVAICDTGVRTTHEDLQLHRLEGYNAVDREWESQGGNIGPVHPHGTNCTDSAAANGNNGVGVAGVGWDLSHRMMRVSNSSGGGAYSSDLQHAARTAVENGDRVASISYSGPDSSSNLTTATYIKSIGGLMVYAAGNDGRNLTYGNRDNDDLIVVGATDSGDGLAYFSAYGQFVDVTAPGVSIHTTDAGHDSDYASVSGTSFSTPLTAGLIALIWSADPSLTPDQVEQRLKDGCDDLGSGGVDNTYGYGRVDVYGSLSQGGPPPNQPPSAAISASPESGVVVLDVDFDASASFDSDGTIVEFEWDLDGNGSFETSTGTTPTTQYTYAAAGDYDVSVRVTDDDDATDTASVLVSVTDPVNQPPQAAISANPESGLVPLYVDFDASASFDLDGYITGYEWDLDGNGSFETSTGGTAFTSYTYTASGNYLVVVRVTDDLDATDTASVLVTVTDPVNEPPQAALTGTPQSGDIPLTVDFDASGSYDPDGYITGYEWDLDGNGSFETSTGSSPYAQYTYTAAGNYDVTVRVTDDGDETDTASFLITAIDPGGGGDPEQIAFDGFESRNFRGGIGWTGTWVISGDTKIRWKKDYPHTGLGHARLRQVTGYMHRVVDLSGVTQASLDFWGKVYSFEDTDQLHVLVSPDGSSWTQVQVLDPGDSDGAYHYYSIDLSGFAMTSTFHIAFDAEMSGRGDYFWVDDIEIIGVR